MLKKKLLNIIIFVYSLLLISCTSVSSNDLIEIDNNINLKWNKSYEDDVVDNAVLGLSWCYSHLGAQILNSIVLSNSNEIITVDITQLGFKQNAIEQIEILHQKIKETQEYTLNNTIDLGRYISLLIGASEHYFAITDIPYDLNDILSNYDLKADKGYINDSGVSLQHRIIEYSDQNDLTQLFISTEVNPQDGEILEYETIEIMDNGQLKFGLFDADGNRKNVGNPEHTIAGKPAKCMWCHESNINRLFTPQNDFLGYLTYLQTNDTLINFNNQLKEKQSLLTSGVAFNNTQDHVLMELLYISFMEPSAERLSFEWSLSVNEIETRLSSLNTHIHPEFSFLGELYNRNEVEQFAPFESLQVSSSVREQSDIEVNYIN